MFNTMAEVKAANKEIGNNWFSPDTMKWWKTVIETPLLQHRYFVTSEPEFAMDGRTPQRKYTLREVLDDGSIKTVQPSQRSTLEGAKDLIP